MITRALPLGRIHEGLELMCEGKSRSVFVF